MKKMMIIGVAATATIAATLAMATPQNPKNSKDTTDVIVQKDIQELDAPELREKYGNTSEYVHMYWINSDTLRITIGGTSTELTPEEAITQYGDNPFFWVEYNNLMDAAKNRTPYVGDVEMYDVDVSSTIDTDADPDIDIDSIRTETDSRIKEVMTELGLHESEDVMEQLQACCRLQKYIAVHNEYDDAIMEQKTQYPAEYAVDIDLYNAVVLQNGVCTSNSIEMREILSRINIKAECVGLISNDSGTMHMAVLVELMGEYYYFDPTLERSIWQENTDGNPDDIRLCAAGLGEEEYCQFYTPEVIVPRDIQDGVFALPENIASSRIPPAIVQSSL